jgi:hypothetical protein
MESAGQEDGADVPTDEFYYSPTRKDSHVGGRLHIEMGTLNNNEEPGLVPM